MNKNDHLTKEEILGYSGDLLKGEEKYAVGRHLLQCEQCLKQMPPPTVEQVLRAIFEEDKDLNPPDK